MHSSSTPPLWYEAHTELTAQELDFDLHIIPCEAGIKDGIAAQFQPMPEPVAEKPDNSVYNFNAIIDGLLD